MTKVVAYVVGVLWVIGVAGRAHAGPRPSHGIRRITIDYSNSASIPHDLHYEIAWRHGAYLAAGKTVDPRAVDALAAALVDLQPSDVEQSCWSHADDYPHFTIAIEGRSRVTLRSRSNCTDHAPWNVTKVGKSYAQYNGAIGRAVADLMAEIDRTRWQRRGALSFGTEYVELGVFRRGGSSPREATRCANSLETDPRARALLGPVQVTTLRLRCQLDHGLCDRRIAAATFAWGRVDAELEMACVGGAIQVDEAALATVRAFLGSKPARIAVKLSTERPRLGPGRHGLTLRGSFPEVPELTLDARHRVITARSVGNRGPGGVVFWNALGLDPSKLTRPSGRMYETSVKLDFAGKLVP